MSESDTDTEESTYRVATTYTSVEDEPVSATKGKTKKQIELENLVLGSDRDVLQTLEDEDSTSPKKRKLSLPEKKTPVWDDSDDHIDLRLTKFQKNALSIGSDSVTAEQYGHKLRSKFEYINSTPNWVTKRVDDVDTSDADSDVEEFKKTTGDCLVPPLTLPKGTIDLKRCTDANRESPYGAKLKCVEFHPTAQVLLTAGMDHRLSLFQVDGRQNPHIQSSYFTNFPIYTAHFTADGCEVVVGSRHANFYYYDMIAGKIVNVPRIKAIEEASMRHFEVSPDGKYLAFRGKYGFIHLLLAKSKEWISSLKMNGRVASIAFTKDGSKLFSHGEDGQVYVWDMRTRDCIHRFFDEGCIHGTSLAVSHCARYLACGSNTGVVNVYETDVCLTSSTPRPLKAIMNLTTSCSSLRFNSSSEVLALASSSSELGIKLFHMPSLSVFSNFPDRVTDKQIRMPICVDFSLNSGYLSVGTNKGVALLYRVKHFGNY